MLVVMVLRFPAVNFSSDTMANVLDTRESSRERELWTYWLFKKNLHAVVPGNAWTLSEFWKLLCDLGCFYSSFPFSPISFFVDKENLTKLTS